MQFNKIHSCHLGPEISPEQFIPEHFFMYLLKGAVKAYDGRKQYMMRPGDGVIARKNHLIRYTKFREDDQFQKIVITLDKPFLKRFLDRHTYNAIVIKVDDSFLLLDKDALLENYILSLAPYYSGEEKLDETFADLKREELLLILLRLQPELADVFFNFAIPDKIDLEQFMNHNFRFNVSLERFALLTGRSLSSFKRDFKQVFGIAPGIWLKQKRLEEAYFLLRYQGQKPGEVYIQVGFENLSHFSFAFKNAFGKTPTQAGLPDANQQVSKSVPQKD